MGVELSLVKDSNERLTKEYSSLNGSLASLKNDHSLAQEILTSLTTKYHELELNYEKLWLAPLPLPRIQRLLQVKAVKDA